MERKKLSHKSKEGEGQEANQIERQQKVSTRFKIFSNSVLNNYMNIPNLFTRISKAEVASFSGGRHTKMNTILFAFQGL